MNLILWLNTLFIELKIKHLDSLLFFLMISSQYNVYALSGVVFAFIWRPLKAPVHFSS